MKEAQAKESKETNPWKTRSRNAFGRCRESRRLVLLVVAVALLVERMLLTSIVPILPALLATFRQTLDKRNLPERNDITRGENDSIPSSTDPSSAAEPPRCPKNNHTDGDEGKDTTEVAWLFSSKALVQIIVNPIVGTMTDKIGYGLPLSTGLILISLSTMAFAFGRSYWFLLLARVLQGVGSSCSAVAGMGMLASRYPEDRERGIAMGIALGGLAFGCIIGPTFGGFMYEFVGKSSPFVVLAALAFADAILQLLILQPKVKRQELERPSLKQLLKDPYICIAAGGLLFGNMGFAVLEPTLPSWMERTMCAAIWQQGAVYLACSISYLIGTNVFARLGHNIGRWLVTMLGLILMGISLVLVPEAKDVRLILGPLAGLGFSIAMVDASIMPELARLVDLRHSPIYGTVYAVGDVAFCLGFAVGPALAGALVQGIGFDWMLYVMAIVCFLYSPLFSFLRKPPARGEKRRLLEDKDVSSSDGGLDGSSTHELVP